MKLTATYAMPGTREKVFAALIDPVVLRRCIPGCEALAAAEGDRYHARMRIGIAGIKGLFTGYAKLEDKDPPASFTLNVEGKGAPGFVRGRAEIVLVSVRNSTEVACAADVQVGGLIAAVGSRLVTAAAKRMMDDFFQALATEFQPATGQDLTEF